MSLMKSCKCVYLICLNSPLKERDASHKGIGGTKSQTKLGPRIPSWTRIQSPLDINLARLNTLLEERGETYMGKVSTLLSRRDVLSIRAKEGLGPDTGFLAFLSLPS
uniref:Uncharacterized protein n=1 Tax=Oryza barthii TaxID=65489 RepID=A0A0D3GFI3_9ORYZ